MLSLQLIEDADELELGQTVSMIAVDFPGGNSPAIIKTAKRTARERNTLQAVKTKIALRRGDEGLVFAGIQCLTIHFEGKTERNTVRKLMLEYPELLTFIVHSEHPAVFLALERINPRYATLKDNENLQSPYRSRSERIIRIAMSDPYNFPQDQVVEMPEEWKDMVGLEDYTAYFLAGHEIREGAHEFFYRTPTAPTLWEQLYRQLDFNFFAPRVDWFYQIIRYYGHFQEVKPDPMLVSVGALPVQV